MSLTKKVKELRSTSPTTPPAKKRTLAAAFANIQWSDTKGDKKLSKKIDALVYDLKEKESR
ncbi:MAG TPA: hypothetical protein VEA18_01975 [Candidatus Kapabacteria bacterium]|nr:hypothetical protein [Candidatus Kapabacteria bacterium]